jgi:hypothetical protein
MIGAFFDAAGTGAAWAFVSQLQPPPPQTATIALANPAINVGRHGEAEIMLTCTGTAPSCGARLTLTAQDATRRDGWDGRKHEHSATVVIGRALASIPSGETTTVTLQLNRTGRRLLDASQGPLAATLTILKFDPTPEEEQTDPVELVRQNRNHRPHEHRWSAG